MPQQGYSFPRSDAGKTTLKEFSKVFHGTEISNYGMLEANLNLERSTIHQGIEKMFPLYRKLYDKKASTNQATVDMFYTKKPNTLIVCNSNVLNYCVLNKY